VGAEDPPFVAALVFEQLGLTPNSLSVKAASRLIRQTIGPAGFAGLFTIDHAVHPVVSYTNDLNTLDRLLEERDVRWVIVKTDRQLLNTSWTPLDRFVRDVLPQRYVAVEKIPRYTIFRRVGR